ncbi:uncharacterized protein LOC106661158 [Cimex lectularius]|uniref:Uncharacterized protein n=1 Tax=Cimex lectularius TaxID=79782 RepID=A0A8I6TB71_CIMLE|nr:uncharacterized protein LOC106661158 [Cimex lectularius]
MPPVPTTPQAHPQHPPETSTINLEEEGGGGWYIPRPALCRNDTTCTCTTTTERSIQTVNEWLSPTPSSNTSTQSGSSGSLLLTAANLAGLRLEPRKDVDACSIASSTHFTMVNFGNTKCKERKQSCCAKHHISALVITMCALFLVGLSAAIYYIEMRSRSVKYS